MSEEEKKKISELKLPAGFYSHGTDCDGCRGCNVDDYIFETSNNINSDINDDSPLPLEQPKKQFFNATPAKPALTTFGQMSKTNDSTRNIFGSLNSSTTDQGLFAQLSFTTTSAAKETTSIFGSNNIFGGNKSIFSKPTEEPKATTTADEVKKNFSFTNSIKPSVFGQNIFGQAASTPASLTATFGSNPIKTNDDAGPEKSFSFGEATTPKTSMFSFGKLLGLVFYSRGRNKFCDFCFCSPTSEN